MELYKTHQVPQLPDKLIEVARKHAPKKVPYLITPRGNPETLDTKLYLMDAPIHMQLNPPVVVSRELGPKIWWVV